MLVLLLWTHRPPKQKQFWCKSFLRVRPSDLPHLSHPTPRLAVLNPGPGFSQVMLPTAALRYSQDKVFPCPVLAEGPRHSFRRNMLLSGSRISIKALLQLYGLRVSPLGTSLADRGSAMAPLHFLWSQF